MRVELSNEELALIASGIRLMHTTYRFSGNQEYINEICDLGEKIMGIRCNPSPDAREGV